VLLVLLTAGCSSPAPSPRTSPHTSQHTSQPTPAPSWLAMVPGDARTFDGPSGQLILIYVDETYAIDRTSASALTWELGGSYTTDYFVQDDNGTLWWYGRRGRWRAGKHGEQPREIDIVGHRATFGDRSITLSDDGPVELKTPEGVYTR
jgi:hypothetical protein